MIQRAIRGAFLDRKAFTGILFEEGAIADAAMLVGGVAAVGYLIETVIIGSYSARLVTGLISAILYWLIAWLFLGVATWFAGTRLFRGNAQMQTVIRLQGFAVLPILLASFSTLTVYLAYAALVWYLAAVVMASSVALSLPVREASLAVLIGLAFVVVVDVILRIPLPFAGLR